MECTGRRSSVFDDEASAAMMKPSAKDILDRQLASDAKKPASAGPIVSELADTKPSADTKRGAEWMQQQQHPTSTTNLTAAMAAPSNDLSSEAASASKKRRMDPAMLTEASIILPRDSDILFGRGSGIQNHPGTCGTDMGMQQPSFYLSLTYHTRFVHLPLPTLTGNTRFREILEQHLGTYTVSDDSAKRSLVTRLANQMRKDLGMRFLKPAPDGVSWTTVNEKSAIQQKFYQTFRSLRAAAKKK